MNKNTFQRNQTTIKLANGITYELYSFTLYGVDGLVITRGCEVIKDPVGFLKEHYKAQIVPTGALNERRVLTTAGTS